MSAFHRFISSLRGPAIASRPDVLRPLLWLIGIVAALLVFSVYERAPEWFLISHIAIFVLCILFYAGAYAYCLLKDPDTLRSESFSAPRGKDGQET